MWLVAAVRRRRKRREQHDREYENPSISVQLRSTATGNRTENRRDEQQEPYRRESSLPLLYYLGRTWAWDAVTFRCQTHPDEVKAICVDHLGDNVLHWSVFGRPPLEPIEAMLRVCPGLAKVKNKKGFLPLHVACSYRASAEVIQAIVKAYPEAAGEATDTGTYPLHLLCDYGCSVEAIKTILRSEFGALTVLKVDRFYRRNPFYILNERKNLHNHLRSLQAMQSIRDKQKALRAENAVDQKEELERLEETMQSYNQTDFWQKARLLVLAEARGRAIREEDVTDAAALRACVATSQFHPIQDFAILLCQDKMLTPDEHGDLPLHIVAAGDSSHSVLSKVLQANPTAATVRNRDGALPLSIALGNPWLSWSSGLCDLVEANPAALVELGLDDRLYTRLWTRFSAPDVMFLAIRARPEVFCRRDCA